MFLVLKTSQHSVLVRSVLGRSVLGRSVFVRSLRIGVVNRHLGDVEELKFVTAARAGEPVGPSLPCAVLSKEAKYGDGTLSDRRG